ncbi:voltage-dependent calcium channel subunit alpha-2/delta-2-like isoform X2 [Neocloeon triangulifer]|uniref:voltage-dependent calcium channel subunit alpha-2/delta-2-like isoform X2 n=1 Tax=Neocloeon triangulifer TaxID=2078957 RepID=UPI00286EF442|nr:voltage-dependent calcium channel subunit alpha-2/delta-2-like isoform X2 [Neocloeon triangulifer]
MLSLLIVCVFAAPAASDVGQIPSPQTLSKWNFMLENKFSQLAEQVTHFKYVQKIYESDNKHVRLRELNGEGMLKQTLSKMRDLLERKEAALQRLVQAAEDAVSNHKYSPGLNMLDVPYLNMKELRKGDERLRFNPSFLQNVTLKESGVHIPLEIYEGYPQILNGLRWSSALDAVFKENARLDPNLKWQYFGSQRGFMRVYPAFRWPENTDLPDLFDVRRRSWYIQGSVSPKDMIIMIDTSGSVHGQTFDIMKIAVKAMLHTLGENDYVNVAWFNNEVDWVAPCLSTLVPATSHNKRLMFDAVDQLQEGNYTSYSAALEFAYEAFRQFEENKQPWEGSNCHKVIMFFTDGGTEWPEEVILKYQSDNVTRNVRIFTYASGPHPIPTVILKSIACTTNGYYNTLTAAAAIRPRMQDYVKILGRPLIQSGEDTLYEWSNFYRDIGGLGMMATVTLPVANLTEKSNQSLVGVMGVDVALSEIESQYSKQIVGPLGYGFAINQNGFVVFHPRLQDQLAFMEEPSDLDILELEGHKLDSVTVRDAMVAGEEGSLLNVTHLQILDSKHAMPVRMNFHFGQIGNSTFRFCLAIPVNHVVMEVSSQSHEAGLRFESNKGVLVAPWTFCDGLDQDPSVMLLSEAIANNTNNCSQKNLAQHLLWDAAKIGQILKDWENKAEPRARSRFIFTDSGITAVHPDTEKIHFINQRDPSRNGFFKQTAQSKSYVYRVKHAKRNAVRTTSVMVGRKIVIKQQNRVFIAAAVGAEVDEQIISQMFLNITSTGVGSNNEVLCNKPDELTCYLIDQGAVVVASNQENAKIGVRLSDLDPQVMSQLLSEGVFKREHSFSHQTWCPRRKTRKQMLAELAAAGSSRFGLFSASWASNLLSLVDTLTLTLSTVLWWGLPTLGETIAAVGWEPSVERNFSCVTRATWLHHTGRPHFLGAYECDQCVRPITAAFLPDLALLLVVADAPCQCRNNAFIDVSNTEMDACSLKSKFRLRPDTCFHQDNSSDCGLSSSFASSCSLSPLLLVLANLVQQVLIFRGPN